MKRLLLLGLFMLSCGVFAQNLVQVNGRLITSDKKSAENISVALQGTSYGALADEQGYFSFNAKPGHYRLVVFSIAYDKVEVPVHIKVGISNHLPDIELKATAKELEEVVVTGTRTEKRLSEVPVQTTVVGQQSIQKAASVSVIESLQDNIPGLIVTPNAMGNNMRIKGLNSRYVLILVDGERLVSEGAGGNINLDQIDVNNIKRIEMVNGAASALYGSNAVGAVINIITKETSHAVEAGANVIAQSYNTFKTKAHVGLKTKKISSRISAFRHSSDGFGGEGNNVIYAAAYEDYGSNIKFKYTPTKQWDIRLNGRVFSHETFHPEKTLDVIHSLRHNFATGGSAAYTSKDNRYTLQLSSNFDKYLDYNVLEEQNDKKRKKNSSYYLSNRLLNTFSLNDKWEFVGGVEYNYEETFATNTLGPMPTTKSLDDANVFAQADYKPLKDLDIILGMRYTYNSIYKDAFTPKLSLMYTSGHFKFRAGTGTAFRAPSIKELYYNFDHQGMFWVYGNPNLTPEKGLYNSVSTEYTNGTFNASVSLYHNKISNKISQYKIKTDSLAPTELHYTNISSATLQGIDVNVSVLLLEALRLKANYSFCDAKNNATGLQIPGNVKHSATVSLTWNSYIANSPFSLQFSGRFNSSQIYQTRTTDEAGHEIVKDETSKDFSVWKVVLVKPFYINNHMFELTAKVDNVFNTKNSLFVNPGTQYLFGLRYSFN